MPFWSLVKNNIIEAIDKAVSGLEPHRYGVLPTKRSIRLLSFEEDEEWTYSLSMTVFELDKAPPFSALSYTWDTPHQFPHLEEEDMSVSSDRERYNFWRDAYSRPMTFKCNGKRINVRPGRNLNNIFKRLWNAKEPLKKHKYLWTDAICIDQADLGERKAQVLLMGDIYRRAETVIAWLGEDLSDTAPAIQALDTLARIPFRKHEEMHNMSLYEPATYEALGVDFIDRRQWCSVTGFLARRWFNRIWIVQEAVFARQILFLCGDYMIQPETLFNVGKLLMVSGWAQKMMDRFSLFGDVHVPPSGAVATLALMRDDMNGARESRLLDMMSSTRSRQATNPLDNAYGMLNVLALAMGKAPAALDVQPDYERSVPAVMEDTTRMLIRHERNLDIFHQVQDRSAVCLWDQGASFASWTVHWGTRMEPQPFQVLNRSSTAWQPSGSMPKEVPDTSTPHQLTFRAAHLGTIENIADSYYSHLSQQIELALELRDKPYGVRTTQGLSEILWRTTLADCAGLQHPAPDELCDAWIGLMLDAHDDHSRVSELRGSSWQSQQDTLMQRLVSQMRATDSETKFPTVHQLTSVLAILRGKASVPGLTPRGMKLEMRKAASTVNPFIRAAMQCRRLARTDNLLALVPKAATYGDQVWIIPGMSTPFVLRKSGEHYELVGEAYVHGIMRGEMAKTLTFDSITLR